MTGLHWITPDEPADAFPPVERALRDPDGLLAVGGDLSLPRLLGAYRKGIFPWYNPGQPVLWWSPDPRAVLFPAELHMSRSLRRTLRRGRFAFSVNRAFIEVMQRCADVPRHGQRGTWITGEMLAAYAELHAAGYAHSVETWRDGRLVGGIYGVALGHVFFGESMFSLEPDASKAALTLLVREMLARDFVVLDCQVGSAHLERLGSREIRRGDFLQILARHTDEKPQRWQLEARVDDLHAFDPRAEAGQ